MVLSRKVIEQGMFVKHCKVEVYLMELKLCHNRNLEHIITEQFSKADTIGESQPPGGGNIHSFPRDYITFFTQ